LATFREIVQQALTGSLPFPPQPEADSAAALLHFSIKLMLTRPPNPYGSACTIFRVMP
jgi:hypothetical protein